MALTWRVGSVLFPSGEQCGRKDKLFTKQIFLCFLFKDLSKFLILTLDFGSICGPNESLVWYK